MNDKTGRDGSFEYVISESVLTDIATTAALGTKGVTGTRGKGIFVKNEDGNLLAEVHIRACYGADLRTLALTVQQNVAKAIRCMISQQNVTVHVTIEDLSVAK